jgi:hypothetical protein
MSLLKQVDRLAILSILSVCLVVPAAALAGSGAEAPSIRATIHVSPIDASFQGIRAGMTTTEVLARIGQPYRTMRFNATRTTAWDYRGTDSWGYDSEFSVIVDDNGTVVGKIATRNAE